MLLADNVSNFAISWVIFSFIIPSEVDIFMQYLHDWKKPSLCLQKYIMIHMAV